jgi:hypothetical protein
MCECALKWGRNLVYRGGGMAEERAISSRAKILMISNVSSCALPPVHDRFSRVHLSVRCWRTHARTHTRFSATRTYLCSALSPDPMQKKFSDNWDPEGDAVGEGASWVVWIPWRGRVVEFFRSCDCGLALWIRVVFIGDFDPSVVACARLCWCTLTLRDLERTQFRNPFFPSSSSPKP